MGRSCIVCEKPVKKRIDTYYFVEPREAQEANTDGPSWQHTPHYEAKPEGLREKTSFCTWNIFTANVPNTKDEAQKFVNGEIVSVQRSQVRKVVYAIGVWDGESYEDDYFCSGKCAKQQGYASADLGERYVWKRVDGQEQLSYPIRRDNESRRRQSMKLTGNYILRATIGGTLIMEKTSTGPAVFATFDNTPAAKAAIGAIVSGAAQAGGTVYDDDAKQYIAGPLSLMVEPV